MSRRLPQGFSKGGMGCVIGCDAVNISYLYHKKQDCVKAGFRRPLQLPDVLGLQLFQAQSALPEECIQTGVDEALVALV